MEWMLLGRPIAEWIAAAAAFAVIAFGVPILRGIVRRRVRAVEGTRRSWAAFVARLIDSWMRVTTLTVALVCGVFMLDPEPRLAAGAEALLIVVLAFQAIRLAPMLVDSGITRLAGAQAEGASRPTAGTLASLRWVVLVAVYSVILILALQNLGIDVTAMVAGLGIGGIAVALAMQNILGDLFASLTIALDKPFVVGDFIVVGSEMGTVEHVGLKTTRVRSLSGEQLVFANSDLLSSRIRNFKRMSERRVVFGFGVVYSTPPDALEQIPAIVRAAVESQHNVRFDRCHFFRFGGSSLDFEAVYYIGTPDYSAHMDVQQAVHLAIARAFRERGIEFAFPTQTVYFARERAPSQTRLTAHVSEEEDRQTLS